MVDVRRPFSMPSTLLSHQTTANYTLPPLQPARELAHTNRDGVKAAAAAFALARVGKETWASWRGPDAAMKPSQVLSPRTMSGNNNVNPLLAPHGEGLPYKSVPAARQSTQPSHSSLGTVAAAQYTSKAPPIRDAPKSSSRPRSPNFHRDGASSREHGRGGGGAAENNSIASYLQIPSSINGSKGSLADFAAQV